MTRHHKNFIQAYVEEYADGFVPDQFYLWGAISTICAALERKVWVPWKAGLNFYPNMYVFLVSKPGIGKSSAIKPGTKLLRQVNLKHHKNIRILPNKLTEPKLLDLLNKGDYFTYNKVQYNHTSVYYYASEASSCFHDPYGGFAQTVTALYDGDDITKATVSRKELVNVENPCFNLIAGCTFDFLSKLLTTEGILGGFASRITYVVHDEIMKRKSEWVMPDNISKTNRVSPALVEDLSAIHDMTGPFTPTEEVRAAYQDWFPKFDKAYQSAANEKLQSLMARKSTAMKKLPMILSAAESDDRVIRMCHWTHALKLMNSVEEKIPAMIREGQSHAVGTQAGVNNALMKHLIARGPLERSELAQLLVTMGHDPMGIQNTINAMTGKNGLLSEKAGQITLTGDPDAHL